MDHNDLELTLKNDIAEIARMADELQVWGTTAGIPENVLGDLTVALDDLATNVIKYAFPGGGPHHIGISLHRDTSSVKCVISDDGIQFDPLKVKPPNIKHPIEKRKIGGLGILIAKTLLDEVHYERIGERNVLTLCKKI